MKNKLSFLIILLSVLLADRTPSFAQQPAHADVPNAYVRSVSGGDDTVANVVCELRISHMIRFAKTYLGTPYVWGADGEDAFDCSGFVKYVYGHFGTDIPRHSKWQSEGGEYVPITKIKKGDLVFFVSGTYPDRDISHVGIAISDYEEGDFQFIHACKGKGMVCVSQYSDSYYCHSYGGARRYAVCK